LPGPPVKAAIGNHCFLPADGDQKAEGGEQKAEGGKQKAGSGRSYMKEAEIIVGGQAVIEGVMMRAPHSYAVAVRRPDGVIVSKSERLPVLAEKYPLLKLPVIRGSAVLIHSMILGIKALNFSANVVFHEAEKETTAQTPEFQPAALASSAGPAIGPVAVATQTLCF
jgi:uncharacterized protein YqhQ